MTPFLRSLPADDLIDAQMVGRPLPSLGHGEGPPCANGMSVGENNAIPRMYQMSGEL